MRLYSYVVRFDVGFAPNPFQGVCSLATCKQDIRERAAVGDWIFGWSSASGGKESTLVYAMRVDEIVSYDEYWNDPRFDEKRPTMRGSRKQAFGDNIYHRSGRGEWIQQDSRHSLADGSPNPDHIARDTKSERVLLGREFVYFGGDGLAAPEALRSSFGRDTVHAGRGYSVNFAPDQMEAAISWARSLEPGLRGRPSHWPRRTS
jgi:Nucleotide modification associated domain 2